jgi:arsenite-transporting ATPase
VLQRPIGDAVRAVRVGAREFGAREVDAARLLGARRAAYLEAVQDVFDALRGGSSFDPAFDRTVVEDLIDLAPPGIDELFGMLAVIEALGERGPFDTVVLDTAPTGHALRLLQMPDAALEWVHAFMAILLKYRQVIGLGDLGADLLELSRDLRRLQALLRDRAHTRAFAVTRAAELPRLETGRLVRELRRLGLPLGGVIVNALTPPGCPRCRAAAEAERRVVGELARDVRATRRGPATILAAPALVPPPRGVAALARWRRNWTTREPR